jgi:hypothetical protein
MTAKHLAEQLARSLRPVLARIGQVLLDLTFDLLDRHREALLRFVRNV